METMQTMQYKLIRPNAEMQADYEAYIAAWEALGQPMVPWAADLRGMRYPQWLAALDTMQTNPPEGLVPSTLFAFVDETGCLLGFLDLRHNLTEGLLHSGGHIGYSLHPLWRGKGLAPKMLALGLEEARKLGLGRVLITCDKTNAPSAKTILHCGGVLENEVPDPTDGHTVQRYWVELAV